MIDLTHYKPFNPVQEGCLVVQAWYASAESGERQFVVRTTCKGEPVTEEVVPWGNANPYGPDVDDFLALERMTQKLIEEADCECSS